MTLLDFIQRLLGLQTPSADTAKQRLRLVLAHDRSDLNPELLEQMRREILEVVQRYVEIDLDAGDVNLATEDQVTALVANLPIKRALPRPLRADGAGAGGPNGKTSPVGEEGEAGGVGGAENSGDGDMDEKGEGVKAVGDESGGSGGPTDAHEPPDPGEGEEDRPGKDAPAASATSAGDASTPGAT